MKQYLEGESAEMQRKRKALDMWFDYFRKKDVGGQKAVLNYLVFGVVERVDPREKVWEEWKAMKGPGGKEGGEGGEGGLG